MQAKYCFVSDATDQKRVVAPLYLWMESRHELLPTLVWPDRDVETVEEGLGRLIELLHASIYVGRLVCHGSLISATGYSPEVRHALILSSGEDAH